MKQRLYVDVNSSLGREQARHERIPYDLGSLINDMKYYRIQSSLIYSNAAKDYSFVKGNKEIIECIKKSNRLYGVAVIVPGLDVELREGFAYLDALVENGIKAFKFYPKSFKHEFNPDVLEYAAEYMSSMKIPLLIDAEEAEWRDIRYVLQTFDQLQIVLCNTYWHENRFLFPLMEKYGNLFFDINSNQANDILDICKKHFGTDRILFGSDYPHKVTGGVKALIEYSGLSENEKDEISCKNAAKLFNINEIFEYSDEECRLDELALKADCGERMDNVLVIDAHTHLVNKDDQTISSVRMLNGDEDYIVKKMDRLGIDKIFICPWEGLSTDGTSANATSLEVKGKYGDLTEVYAMCNPNYKEDLDAVVDVFHEKHRFKGLKPFYINQNYDMLDRKLYKWFSYGNRNKLIMLVHASNTWIADKIEILSENYPDMIFLMSHSGASYEVANKNISLAKKRKNVYLEITYTTMTNGIIEYMVEQVGADRVIFGTDMPMRDPAPQLAWVCYSKITVSEKKKILGENILGLLNRCYS